MSNGQQLFATQRSRLVQLYEAARLPFEATTKPYKSCRPLIFEVVDAQGVGNVMAHAVARAGQELRWFAYGVGDSIPDGLGRNFEATDAETNQGDSNNTNGNSDFVIEGLSSSAKGVRIKYAAGTATTAPGTCTDKDVIAAYEDTEPMVSGGPPPELVDPAALASPPQVGSPFNLEQALMIAAAPLLAISIVFDRENTEKIGTMDEIPEGGAKSFLRAHGDPRTDNRYRIPEGYMWRRAGEADSHMNIVGILKAPIVVPITLVGLFGAAQETQVKPLKIALDIVMRVHGLNVKVPSNN